jgi:O-acetylserine/cysteine efflux transporter
MSQVDPERKRAGDAKAMKPADIALAISVQFLWGIAFTLGKPAVAQFPALLLMALIYGVTAVCLFPYIRRIKTPFWPLFILTAFTATLQEGLIVSGLALLPESTTVLLTQLFVPFSVVFAWVLVRERPTCVRVAGTTFAFLGVIIIVGAPGANLSWLPVTLIVGGTAFGAAGTVMARRYSRDDGLALIPSRNECDS